LFCELLVHYIVNSNNWINT